MQQTPDTTPLAHSVPDACRRLGVGRSKLYELIDAGEIRRFKVGAKALIPDADLVAFVAKRLEAAQ